MAPHSLVDLHDSSGYTSPKAIDKRFFRGYRNSIKSNAASPGTLVLDSKDLAQYIESGSTWQPYFWHLSPSEIETVERSVDYFQSLDLPLNRIDKATFPLNNALRGKLENVVAAVYGKQQFLIVSGLDPTQYSDFENVVIHAGISSHVGGKRGMAGREGGDNSTIQHIIAMIASPKGTTGQYHGPPNQAGEIPFHTDNGDIVSLYALSTSQTGGSFYLAGVDSVYQDLLALKPELARALTQEWTLISPATTKDYDTRPLVFPNHPSGRILINCSRARITGTPCRPRSASLPPLTKTQRQALKALQNIAAQRAIEIRFQPGDMIFFNNMSMLHARDSFVDNDQEGRKRHLLRLILRNERWAYETPNELQECWAHLYEHEVGEEIFPVKSELFSFALSH